MIEKVLKEFIQAPGRAVKVYCRLKAAGIIAMNSKL